MMQDARGLVGDVGELHAKCIRPGNWRRDRPWEALRDRDTWRSVVELKVDGMGIVVDQRAVERHPIPFVSDSLEVAYHEQEGRRTNGKKKRRAESGTLKIGRR